MNEVSCQICSRPVSTKPLKSWKFGKFDVGRYQCLNCKSKFNFYQSSTRTYNNTESKIEDFVTDRMPLVLQSYSRVDCCGGV